ncbi:MAG TPA: DUF6134 family protein [Stellaceae bacterium]|nr:DUF6134 family protein [Stellaceae bacterium]
MNPIRLTVFVLAMAWCALGARALASEQIYTYTVVHPILGEIGSFTDRVNRSGVQTRVDTQLHVLVRILGVVAYREESQGSEVLEGDRLISLESDGDRDGQPIDVHGRVQDGKFVVKSRAGTISAPLDITPSDPWLVRGAMQAKVVSTRTGQIVDVSVTGGETVTIQLQGVSAHARHYLITGDKRQEVWMADNGIPLMMRSIEDNVPIDFVLKTPLAQAVPGFVAAAAPTAPQVRTNPSDR